MREDYNQYNKDDLQYKNVVSKCSSQLSLKLFSVLWTSYIQIDKTVRQSVEKKDVTVSRLSDNRWGGKGCK